MLTANVTGLVLGIAMYLGISLITQVVQLPAGIGQTVFVAGLTLLPMSIVSTTASRFVPTRPAPVRPARRDSRRLPRDRRGRCCSSRSPASLWQAFVVMALVGLGLGLTFAAMPGLIVSLGPAERDEQRDELLPGDPLRRVLDRQRPRRDAAAGVRRRRGVPTESAYSKTFAVGAVLCLVAAVIAYAVPAASSTPRTRRPRSASSRSKRASWPLPASSVTS